MCAFLADLSDIVKSRIREIFLCKAQYDLLEWRKFFLRNALILFSSIDENCATRKFGVIWYTAQVVRGVNGL